MAKKAGRPIVYVGTRKGAWFLKGDPSRRRWSLEGPFRYGEVVYHLIQDPRDPSRLLMAAKPGHLSAVVLRSRDEGRTWTEASAPPAFPKGDPLGRAVQHVFWLTPGHASRPAEWYAGTAPHGIFRSRDHGDTWEGVSGFNDNPKYKDWRPGPGNDPPDAPNTHSICVDPRDPAHLYAGFSGGGFFESTDEGRSWTPLNRGCAAEFLPEKDAEYGHDPHCVVQHPANPDRLYMQNHCGIYRLDRPETRWIRIGDNMPRKIGDIGFPMVVHPRDPNTCWVFPMDGTSVWPRTSVGGKPAAYVTRDAGKSWKRLDKGFPRSQAWWTVKRQAMAADDGDPVALHLGTTNGEVWSSTDEGRSWRNLARHLPHVYSVTTGRA